jgi:PAS domain S-box-containing protein
MIAETKVIRPGIETHTTIPDLIRLCHYALERSPQSMVVTEGRTHIVRYANPAFCRLAGRERAELIGRPFAEAVLQGAVNGCQALLDRVYCTGEADSITGQEYRHGNSTLDYWSYTAWALLDAAERPEGVMFQVTDTTESVLDHDRMIAMNEALVLSDVRLHESVEVAVTGTKRLQQAMRETDHRVKNNLQSIAALLDMQTVVNADTVPIKKLTEVRMLIKTLSSVHDMLTQDVKHDPMVSMMSAKAALEKLLPMLQEIVGAAQIAWSADEVRLPIKQGISLAVLVNELVSNAIKHGGQTVGLRLMACDTFVRLEVCDDGPGFREAFDPRTDGHFGVELIESVSHHDLSGETTYENLPEGGACVRVTFPLRPGKDL